MKTTDLNKKTQTDLLKLLHDKREALSSFRFGVAGSKVTNVKEGRNLRREIAQIATRLQEMGKSAKV
ncbi:MAG: 50S ribosomal protein L29 [Candidatus Vogelbacteria bacterium RIFOXYD1_FULL_46_19]|uniref:Large ribosomal subunit protein uL29 n=1 Tax=Candidatus Vogelbacteria bacterium RIFOXYD1_FULL_46_19 TaxID=1802439 RepID=A0A1G2QIC0_9BACT|nr:MAG: 50S ribosomal protein L29 [Candidatus Vogelbacteria bacterium RIFOXYD1_FULL_46_19]